MPDIDIALKQQDIANQELQIANLRTDQSQAAVKFLATKFTNAELYEWMSGVLIRVYSYFLQQAASIAHLAQNQLNRIYGMATYVSGSRSLFLLQPRSGISINITCVPSITHTFWYN